MNSMYDPDALAMGARSRAVTLNRVYNFVYGWMAVGLAITGIVAAVVANAFMSGTLVLSNGLLMVCALAEVGIVFFFRAAVQKFPPMAAAGLFAVFSALNGVTLSTFFLIYTTESIATSFFMTAGTFATMAIIGTVTKRDLSALGRICMMALIGIVIVMLVNLFVGSSGLSLFIDVVCLAVFVGLTAYDAQNVRHLAAQQRNLDSVALARFGLVLALELYLDFINLFIVIMRFFGDRR